MKPRPKLIAALFALGAAALAFTPTMAKAEKRIALVVGNAGYQAGALNTPANDAGLIAQTLQAAGFDVAGARDLDQDSLRHALRDFVEKATAAGPDTVAFVYVSGYGVQLEGENYFVPIDAKIARDVDVAAEAVRVSDYTRPLAALKLKASIVVLDAARANPFARSGAPLAGGLALVDPDAGVLIAFNAAPGTVAPEGQGPYGPYAQALAEMIREGGSPLNGVFERTRLRVNELTKGAEVPWQASKLETSVVFFERAADAPPPAVSVEETAAIRARPIRELRPQEAYTRALERDTLEGYSEFCDAYPDDPMAPRVRVIIAARREAITWRRTRIADTPPAYWSYLRRYPEGPHGADAHRRLAFLAAALEPPPVFAAYAYDVPPPPPEEIVYIRRPVLVFDDPVFGFAPPPPAPVIFLAPPPPEFVVLAPPPPPVGLFMLPIPVYRPVPLWVRPPAYVAPPPPNNVIYNNVHNTVVVNNVTNTVTVTNRTGQTRTITPPAQAAAPAQGGRPGTAAAAPAAIGPSLPPSVAQKAVSLQTQSPPAGTPTTTQPGVPAHTGRPLPGMQGQPLPSAKGTPSAPAAALSPAQTPAPGTGAGTGRRGMPPKQPGTAALPATPSTGPSGAPPAATLTPTPGATQPTTPGKPTSTPHAPTASIPSATSPALQAPANNAKPAIAPPPPAARIAPPPQVHPAPPKPATPPPAAMVRPAAPPPPPQPAVRAVAPPPPPPPPPPRPAVAAPAPAAAAAKPACPPGKAPAVVNGQTICK